MMTDEVRAKLARAFQLQQRGHLSEAAALYRDILRAEPANADALRLLGICHFQGGQYEVGIGFLEKVLTLQPDNAEAHNDIATALRALHRPDEAIARYQQALTLRPRYADAHYNLAVTLQSRGRHGEAVAHYRQVLAIRPEHLEAHNNLGAALNTLGRHDEAIAHYREALAIKPDYAQAHGNMANVLASVGRHDEAVFHYRQALAGQPADAETHNNLGTALQALQRFDEAAAQYESALAIRPDYAEAHNNLGVLLQARERHADAIAHYEQALAIDPNLAEVHNNLGNALTELRRYQEALGQYQRALSLNPRYADAHSNLGHVLGQLSRHEEAIAHYEQALAGEPRHVEAHDNLGLALAALHRFREAVAHYRLALAARPEAATTHINLANALKALNRHEEAIVHYEKALALQPDLEFLYGTVLHARMTVADWRDIAAGFDRIRRGIEAGRKICDPFSALSMPLSPRQHRQCAQIYAQDLQSEAPPPSAIAPRRGTGRIHVGYFSNEFHRHATSYLAAGLFEQHDRTRFEVIAFSYGPPKQDAMRTRLEAAFDRFLDVHDMSDPDIAQLARSLDIDIAVDLKGFTKDGRSGIFASRAAPVQMSYLGYPGTLGAPYMDYLIADPTLVPESHRSFYSEKLAYLPHTYQVNDSRRPISDRRFTRSDVGLPDDGFVFCCFNKHYKITAEVFDIWMRLLGRIGGSVLWLFEETAAGARNLRSEAAARGIAPDRLVFAPEMDLPDHLARHRLADLFLDTLLYNAHTTASDALWAGLPLITCPGETFASRVAASLLKAVGLPMLVTESLAAYEALALDLAIDPQKLRALKETLAANRSTHPLFDTARFTRHMEAAYMAMWQRYQTGLPLDHIVVPADEYRPG